MSVYLVSISTEAVGKSPPIFSLDLTTEQLIKQIVGPYRCRQDLMLHGAHVNDQEIIRLQIHESTMGRTDVLYESGRKQTAAIVIEARIV